VTEGNQVMGKGVGSVGTGSVGAGVGCPGVIVGSGLCCAIILASASRMQQSEQINTSPNKQHQYFAIGRYIFVFQSVCCLRSGLLSFCYLHLTLGQPPHQRGKQTENSLIMNENIPSE